MHSRESILDILPDAERILRREVDDPPYDKVAISIFDRWLGDDLHLLDCRDQAERETRNRRLLAHWARVYDETEVFVLNSEGVLASASDREAFLIECGYDPDKTSDRFQFVVLPEFKALYHEYWDDTNVLWYADRTAIAPMLDWARECDLHVVEYDASS